MKLRPYQTKAIDEVRVAFLAGHKAVLLVVPTGGGKTPIFSDICRGVMRKAKRCLILAHRRELIRQASEKLHAFAVEHGIIAPGFPATKDLVKVGSVPTIVRRLERMGCNDFHLVVIDEAHHAVADTYRKILAANPKAFILGVTATPSLADGRGLGTSCGGIFDFMILGPQPSELIEDGYLVRTRIFRPDESLDLSHLKVNKDGDYDDDDVAAATNVPTITGNAVEHYEEHAAGLPTLVFCANVQHAKDVARTFREAGWRAVAVDGTTPAGERDDAMKGLKTGAVQLLCTADLIDEGVDIPRVSCIIALRFTKSLRKWMQQIGRGLRPIYAPGFDLETREGRLAAIAASEKPFLILLDHVWNTLEHGRPNLDHEWSLEGQGKKKPTIPPVVKCPKCFADHTPAAKCPECEYVYPKKTAEESTRALLQVDGKLVEDDGTSEPPHYAELRKGKLADALTGRETMKQLVEIGKARGFKPQWAWMQFNEHRRLKAEAKAA
jgi:DNA repair protein RadD